MKAFYISSCHIVGLRLERSQGSQFSEIDDGNLLIFGKYFEIVD